MKYKTAREYREEIARVQSAIDRTSSEHLKSDYGKYIRRLKRELRTLERRGA